MNIRNLVFLGLLGVTPVIGGCPNQSAATVLSEVEAGISDAGIAIQTIVVGVDAYFATHPNATLQSQIDAAIADTSTALRAVNNALAGASSISDGNVQQALTSFSQAYAALMQLVGQIGVQTAPTGVTAAVRVNGVVYVPSPRILTLVKNAASAARAR